MVDAMHGRQDSTARKRFNENKERFIEGKHFHKISSKEASVFRTLGISVSTQGFTVLTERGYLLLVKSFSDEKSWEVQEHLIDGYFRSGGANLPPKPVTPPLLTDDSEQWYLTKMRGGAIIRMVLADEPCAVKFMRDRFPHLEVVTKEIMRANLMHLASGLIELSGQFITSAEIDKGFGVAMARSQGGAV